MNIPGPCILCLGRQATEADTVTLRYATGTPQAKTGCHSLNKLNTKYIYCRASQYCSRAQVYRAGTYCANMDVKLPNATVGRCPYCTVGGLDLDGELQTLCNNSIASTIADSRPYHDAADTSANVSLDTENAASAKEATLRALLLVEALHGTRDSQHWFHRERYSRHGTHFFGLGTHGSGFCGCWFGSGSSLSPRTRCLGTHGSASLPSAHWERRVLVALCDQALLDSGCSSATRHVSHSHDGHLVGCCRDGTQYSGFASHCGEGRVHGKRAR